MLQGADARAGERALLHRALLLSLLLAALVGGGEGSGQAKGRGGGLGDWKEEVLSGLDDERPVCGGRLCAPSAECVRDGAGFKCACPKGFTGDGYAVCADKCAAGPAQRVDCFQDSVPSQGACLERGCCWDPSKSQEKHGGAKKRSKRRAAASASEDDPVPSCFFPLSPNSYLLKNVVEWKHGLTGTLYCSTADSRGGGAGGIGTFGSDVCPLKLVVAYEAKGRVRVRITDAKTARWEVPESLFAPKDKLSKNEGSGAPMDYAVTYTSEPFGIAITRVATGETLLNTTQVLGLINGLSFEEQYWELSSTVEEGALLYGLGQQKAPMKLPAGEERGLDVYTLWARDPGGTPGHTAKGGSSLYASHPFLMQVSRKDGSAHGLFFRTSNALDVALTQQSMTFRGVGGIIDFTLFMGPTQKDVVSQYTAVIGRPRMPPFWALGFHMCKWGYGSVHATKAVVKRMRLEGVPQDSQWNDIDYMDAYKDFTLDPKTFHPAKMAAFVEDLHAHNQRYVMIVDAAIKSDEKKGHYPPLDAGLDMNVFIKTKGGDAFRGKVWPGYTHFPDFFHPNASVYWHSQLKDWKKVVDYDGIWLDMNEPSNFCDGECPAECDDAEGCDAQADREKERKRLLYAPWRQRLSGGRAFDPEHPPYIPGGASSLDLKTVSMAASHCVQEPPIPHLQMCSKALHYDTHNLYGISEARVTAGALEKILDKRSLIISRSTFPGSGRFGGAWLGDSSSTWEDMRLSIPGILSMGMFGVPLVGADICGFVGNTTREMCIRWHQLGSMYPFARNHNDIHGTPQEPYAFDAEALAIIKGALLTRYSLTPYMYTLFHDAHRTGVPVARSLLMEFSNTGEGLDTDAASVEEQFMLGGALLVSPVLRPDVDSVTIYLPKARWYRFKTGAEIHASPGWADVFAPIESLPLHVRGGSVIPLQQPATTTAAVRASAFTLLAALGDDSRAKGKLLLDDGETFTSSAEYTYARIVVHAASGENGKTGNLSTTVSGFYDPATDPSIGKDLKIEKIVFYGIGAAFPWESDAQFVVAGVLLEDECIEKDLANWAVKVSLGMGTGCGNLPSIMEPLTLMWWSKAAASNSIVS